MVRDPADVPVTLVNDRAGADVLGECLGRAVNVAIDTEVPIAGRGAGLLRVASVATRSPFGDEHAFVVDARDLDPRELAPLLDGIVADAWNASFDARVIDRAVFESDDVTRPLRWWDAQLADALLHQGQSGVSWYHGLAWAAEHYLGVTAQGKGTTQLSYTATDNLTDEQVAYSAADAVETLWVADKLRSAISQAGLDQICAIEMAARPFLDRMERSGLPFDWPGWQAELDTMQDQHRTVVGALAELTGGGQGTLFDDVTEPSWNPASDKQVRAALNRWAKPQVAAWTSSRFGSARPLTERDSVRAGVLREIGGELCEALLEFRDYSKILTTYGDSIREHIDSDDRMRPQYLQVVGTNTGRLASRNPNAQNFTPRMKPYVRPPDQKRVFVHADLSQAELRFLAQVANDEPLKAAFARGEDVHVSTAASMFGFDPAELAQRDPTRFGQLRQIAKALNFGIAYGTGPAALARSLTANGTPTSLEEGRTLLGQYRQTYPGTTAWANERIAEIDAIRRQTRRIDWIPTMRLARNFSDIAAIRRDYRRTRNRWPNAREIAELRHPGETITSSMVDTIEWVLQFSAPVALVGDDEAFTFSSRTLAGRRQQFNLHLDRLFLVAAVEAVESRDPKLVELRTRFQSEHNLVFQEHGRVHASDELAAQFEERSLRRQYIDAVAAVAGEDTAHAFLARAAKGRVQAMVNAWRNAPIQGGVADIMLDAFARLHDQLWAFPSARPVQTVHDSVVVECDRSDAQGVAHAVREALEQASLHFCPDVRPKADIDIRRSLSDSDIIDAQPRRTAAT